ncbi:hypothetical protein MXL49_16705 [Enterococcus casseliflavus]|uniref:hypothetical protein n=1 Tax=Enterococcus casseliflavus TaxID=37734 RepID=UPI002DBAE79A|nr:hypothetical protein [Enterococcus casseliflavus]MEB6213523.1 hypothetical protein [Enterococcus casseliflavus]
MKYDQKAQILISSSTSDGMGGWIPDTEVIVQTLDSFLTPVRASVMAQEYGVSTPLGMKMFTKSEVILNKENLLKQDVTVLTPDQSKYKLVEYTDFGKIKMFVLEGVEFS